MFVAQAGARQDQRRQARIADIDRQARGNQDGLARLKDGVLLEHGAQVQAGGARCGVGRQGKVVAEAWVEDLGL